MSVSRFPQELAPCICGGQPLEVEVHYGRTPYNIACPNCKKQQASAKCETTGGMHNPIDYWNKIVSKLTKEEMIQEKTDSMEERRKWARDNYCSIWDAGTYYWYEGKGEQLIH